MAVLTGGWDQPYAFGLATALMNRVAVLDLIGNDELDSPIFRNAPCVNFFNLRGDQRPDANFATKALRVLRYYVRLIRYSATAKPKLFHILWNNKFEYVDRTILMFWYRLIGKRIALTLHNVNARKRDGGDSALNRLTLGIQYRLADHIFVHTERMKQDLMAEFAISSDRITVIPFGINNAVPDTELSGTEARRRLGLADGDKCILFFGNIAPYKGLEYLVDAFQRIKNRPTNYKLIIAGRPKNCESYWNALRAKITEDVQKGSILLRDEYIPDEDTEIYMKAADVLVLPYRYIYQSGVLFLGYSFGLPVLAADVGSLRDEVIEGKTGFMFRSEDPEDVARAIQRYFASGLYENLSGHRQEIRDYAKAHHSWETVGEMTADTYSDLLFGTARSTATRDAANTKGASGAAFDPKIN